MAAAVASKTNVLLPKRSRLCILWLVSVLALPGATQAQHGRRPSILSKRKNRLTQERRNAEG